MSDGALYDAAQGISAAAIRRTLEAALGPLVAARTRAAAGCRSGALLGARMRPGQEVGIISAMTEHFCDDCNRLAPDCDRRAPRVPGPR